MCCLLSVFHLTSGAAAAPAALLLYHEPMIGHYVAAVVIVDDATVATDSVTVTNIIRFFIPTCAHVLRASVSVDWLLDVLSFDRFDRMMNQPFKW